MLRFFFIGLLALGLAAPAAAAPLDPNRSAWTYANTVGVSANPIALLDLFWVRYEKGLYGADNALLEQNFFSFSAGLNISPIFLQPGVRLEMQPLSILRFAVSYEPVFYFGNNGFLPTYPDATATWNMPFSAAVPSSPSNGHAAVVHQIFVTGIFQFALGPVAFQNAARAMWSHMSPHGSDRTYYSVQEDILLASTGWMLHNDTVLLYNFDFGLSAGVAHALIATAYPPESYLPGQSQVNGNAPISRVGPLFLYKFNDRQTGQWQHPTLLLALEWYIKQRYRTGLDVPRSVPYILLVFSFAGDL